MHAPRPVQVIARLLFFSVTTMTTTGLGDVYPTQWYSRLAVTAQLLLATLYAVVILGMGLGRLRRRGGSGVRVVAVASKQQQHDGLPGTGSGAEQ